MTRLHPARAPVAVVLAALTAAAFLLAACDDDRRAISRDDLPSVPAEADETVVLDESGFDPDQLELTTDTLIDFEIEGAEARGIRAVPEDDDDRIVIDTGLLLPGETTSVVFDEPGVYEVTDTVDEANVLVVTATEPAPPR